MQTQLRSWGLALRGRWLSLRSIDMDLRSKRMICMIGCVGLAGLSITNLHSAASAQANEAVAAAVRSLNWEMRRNAFVALRGAGAASLASESGPAADRRK